MNEIIETVDDLINIYEILTKFKYNGDLYSPLLGDIKNSEVSCNCNEIIVYNKKFGSRYFDKYGRYVDGITSPEVMLFPSKDDRDWNKFQIAEGDVFSLEDCQEFIYLYRDENDKLMLIESVEGQSFELNNVNEIQRYTRSGFKKVSSERVSEVAYELCKNVLGSCITEYLLNHSMRNFGLKTSIEGCYINIYNESELITKFHLSELMNPCLRID